MMDLTPETLLGRTFECECSQTHTVKTQAIVYAEDAIDRVPSLLKNLPGRRIAILADARTWEVAGRTVADRLERASWRCHIVIVPDEDGHTPVCDDQTFERLRSEWLPVDGALAVGTGVVNDLTKWLAFDRGIPFAVVATAATMNGFTSANVAPAIRGVKTLIKAEAPVFAAAVPSIIAAAPFELTTAGLGDAIAKPISTADWLMNHLFNGEHFCPVAGSLIDALEPFYLDHPEHLRDKRPQALEALFKALCFSGVAMTVIGTSAPASGGEHLLSHTLDMMSSVDGRPHDLHGRQVSLGTIVAAVLYERVLQITTPKPMPQPGLDEAFWGIRADSVREQYMAKQPVLERMAAKMKDRGTWEEFRRRCGPLVRRPQQIKDCLQKAGAAHVAGDLGCSRDRVRTAMLHMHEIRKRPTVVDLAWLLGILPDAVDDIFDHWLT